jgi:hypothetical protein
MPSPEHPRDRAQRYLAMAETTPDPHIASGLRLLAAAYLEMAAKEGGQQDQITEPERPAGQAD